MSQTCVVPLFAKTGEPSAILQCSGEYFQLFSSWKYAVHFLAWQQLKHKLKADFDTRYQKWLSTYLDEEEFKGDLNEFKGKDFYVSVSSSTVDGKTDLLNCSIWDIENDYKYVNEVDLIFGGYDGGYGTKGELDLNKVFYVITNNIEKKCKNRRTDIFKKDVNLIKALIIYACRNEAKVIEKLDDNWHYTWNDDDTKGINERIGVVWHLADDYHYYLKLRHKSFKRIYKCDSCLGFDPESNSIYNRMEKLLRNKLKIRSVKHCDSCFDPESNSISNIVEKLY